MGTAWRYNVAAAGGNEGWDCEGKNPVEMGVDDGGHGERDRDERSRGARAAGDAKIGCSGLGFEGGLSH